MITIQQSVALELEDTVTDQQKLLSILPVMAETNFIMVLLGWFYMRSVISLFDIVLKS